MLRPHAGATHRQPKKTYPGKGVWGAGGVPVGCRWVPVGAARNQVS
ncbi:MAG: hypothetical protein KME26_33315 [Oscillatoria princeps RMCB-10]|nr:hypothetical protein [Oscillatoria princeps RMCB-10]